MIKYKNWFRNLSARGVSSRSRKWLRKKWIKLINVPSLIIIRWLLITTKAIWETRLSSPIPRRINKKYIPKTSKPLLVPNPPKIPWDKRSMILSLRKSPLVIKWTQKISLKRSILFNYRSRRRQSRLPKMYWTNR